MADELAQINYNRQKASQSRVDYSYYDTKKKEAKKIDAIKSGFGATVASMFAL